MKSSNNLCWLCIWYLTNNDNSVAFSLQANYTNWVIATCRWILVPTFADRRVSCGQCPLTPVAVNLSILDQSCFFFFQVAPRLSSWGWVGSVSDPLLLRKSGCARNQTWDLWVCSQELWLLDCRGGSTVVITFINIGFVENNIYLKNK
jgi:hypothetical protein